MGGLEAKIKEETKREIQATVYNKTTLVYDEIVEKTLNKSHLVFVVDFEDSEKRSQRIIVYQEDRIHCLGHYCHHSNSNSFYITEFGFKNDYKGVLIGSKKNPNIICFKQQNIEKTLIEILINRKGQVIETYPTMNLTYPNTFKRLRIIEMKKTEEEIEKEKKREYAESIATNKIGNYDMLIIGKYFNTIDDYINIEKCCKKYNGIMEQYHFNPIPFQRTKERELFKNIETYYVYDGDMVKKDTDPRIKEFIHWETLSYLQWIKVFSKPNHIYKNVEFGEKDMKELFMKQKNNGIVDSTIILNREKIELPEGITSLGRKAFYKCYNLREIIIPTTVNSIGSSCFSCCHNLSTITIPSSVTYISPFSFYMMGKVVIDPNNPMYTCTDGKTVINKVTKEEVFEGLKF